MYVYYLPTYLLTYLLLPVPSGCGVDVSPCPTDTMYKHTRPYIIISIIMMTMMMIKASSTSGSSRRLVVVILVIIICRSR